MTTSLLGIELRVPDPADYLNRLKSQCAKEFPSLLHVIGNPAVTGQGPQGERARDLGYCSRGMLRSLLHKDWLDVEDNECHALEGYILASGIVHGHEGVSLLGAGLCGLARAVHSAGVKHLSCYDLSWVALYCADLMLRDRSDLLPPEMAAPLMRYEVDSTGAQFQRAAYPMTFKPSGIDGSMDVRHCVTSFASPTSYDGTLLLACNVVGGFRGQPGRSTLLQLLRAQQAGQTMMLVNWVGSEDNTPDEIVATIRETGGRVRSVDLVRLPYSGGGFVFGESRSVFLNAVIVVERPRAFEVGRVCVRVADGVRSALQSGSGDGPLVVNGRPLRLASNERAMCVLVNSISECRLPDVECSRGDLSEWNASWILGQLVTRGILELHL